MKKNEVLNKIKTIASKINQTEPKKLVKIMGLIALGIALLFVIGIIFKNNILPNINYNSAVKKIKSNDYKEAIKLLSNLETYKDSKNLLNKVYYEYGKKLIKEGKYSEAIDNLEKTNEEDFEKYLNYAKSLNALDNKNYNEAIKTLEKMSGFENADEMLRKAYYFKGNELFDKEDFKGAIDYYAKSNEYEDSSNKINISKLLQAEKKYLEGNLQEAKKLYSELPNDLEYKEVKVSDRLDILKKYQNYVNLSGNWRGTNGYFEVKHIYKYDGSWESWYNSYSAEANIKCIIEKDEVKITGDATFYSFTNYSTVSSAVNSKSVTVPINLTINAGEAIPKKLVTDYPALIANSGAIGNTNIEYTGGKIKLNFLLNDKNYSQSFSNKYTSRITYNKED